MSSQIVTANQFVPSEHLMYTKPRINAAGGKSVGIINKITRKSLMVSAPMMLNWGVNTYGEGEKMSYSLSLQFPRDEFSNEKTRDFFSMLKDFENQIKSDAVKNCKDWFGKNMSEEVINAFFNPMLKYPKDKETGEPDLEREPTLKVKLPSWEGEFKFELYDVENTLLIPNEEGASPEAFINKGSQIATILQCGGLWFANGSFGVTWKLYQGVVKPSETLAKRQCHIQLDDNEKEEIKKTVEVADDTVIESDGEDMGESESAGEEQAEPEPEPEPEKPKKKTKRSVKK